MSFYDDVDSTGIIENHIQQVLGLEQSEAQTIMDAYTETRQDLINRLHRYPANSFTAQHLRGVLAQVQGAIEGLNKDLESGMKGAAYDSALQGIDHLVDEVKLFDKEFTGAVTPINLNSALLARDTSNFLVTKYKTNLDAYGNQLYTQISNGLFNASIGEQSYGEVVSSISDFFTAEQWKLHRIVRTELHNIYNMGKVKGMNTLVDDDVIPDLKKTLMHPMDGRTGKDSIFAAQLGLVANINESFQYQWGGRLRVFMAPPDRPNDRAILVPYREEWGPIDDAGFIPAKSLPVP